MAQGKPQKVGIKLEKPVGNSIFELYKENQEILHKIYLAMGDNQVQWFWQVEEIGYEIRVIPLVSETNEIESIKRR